MKIDNSGKPIGTTLTRANEAKAQAQSKVEDDAHAEVSRQTKESVEINAFSSRMQALEASLANQPVIDRAKVEQVRQAIAEGKFKVRADAIADKLMASVKELLGE